MIREQYNRKEVLQLGLLTIVLTVVGLIAGYYISKNINPRGYSDKDFDAFKAGYHDSYITISKEFMIKNCANGIVQLRHYIDFKSIDRGIIYYCPINNLTLPLTYTRYHYSTELKGK